VQSASENHSSRELRHLPGNLRSPLRRGVAAVSERVIVELMTGSEVTDAYGSQAGDVANMLGTVVSAEDPDRIMIESSANTVSGRILDIGSGTGRWSGHLAELGHTIAGFEPVEQLVEIARRAHPDVQFRLASIDDLVGSEERWSGILAWYSLIHLGPDKLPDVLTTLRRVLEDGGTALISFFSGPRLEAFSHPVTTAYRWPMEHMTRALEQAGFEVTGQHWDPSALHAVVIARADSGR